MKNNSLTQTDSPGRRAAAYWFMDGLPEIVFGVALLLFGAFAMWSIELPNLWVFAAGTLAGVFYFAMLIMHRRILVYLKRHVTFQRTGYARPPIDYPNKNDWSDKILTLGIAHRINENVSSFLNRVVVVFICGTCLMQFLPASWGLPLVMTIIAVILHFWNRKEARSYSWGVVIPIAVAGIVVSRLGLKEAAFEYAPIAIGGAWLLGMGSWTLVRYLHANPRRNAGEEAHT